MRSSDLHLPSLSIKGFRGISDLVIKQLGRVTLIGGQNNAGKSSILEAVRLLATEASPDVIQEILQYREEYVRDADKNEGFGEVLFNTSALFHGFPKITKISAPIIISSAAEKPQQYLKIQGGWFSKKSDKKGNETLVPQEAGDPEEAESVERLAVESSGNQRHYHLNIFGRRAAAPHADIYGNVTQMPCMFVNPSNIEDSGMLVQLWDSIALTDDQQYVIEALRIIEPSISALSMINTDDSYRSSRTAIVRSDMFPEPVALRSFGDGLNRLFSIILSLVNARGGFLLIDEFENGLHHTAQYDIWRAVFRLARQLKVQVLATTHSWDALVSFARAIKELELQETEGVYMRLEKEDAKTRAVIYAQEDLMAAASYNIETR